jgi:hypothetical protein
MTRSDRVVLTLEGARIWPDIGTREGTILFLNGDIVIVRWDGLPGVSNLRREFVEEVDA